MEPDFLKRFFVIFAAGVVFLALPLLYLEQRAMMSELMSQVEQEEERLVPVTSAAERAGTQRVWVTAYSSTPEETDDSPFVTALGTRVRDGIIAANFLPFGTRVMIPSLFGDRTFIVEDRMHYRKQNFIDVWMPSKEEAQQFGIARADVVVLD